ncbi:MAG: hypothetical protein HQK54_02200, partial [Oligoflexales bacterium]|nr:hypothetical protein [Oligoflexales bacterium]
MSILVRDIRVPVDEKDHGAYIRRSLEKALGLENGGLPTVVFHRKSLDARNKQKIHYKYQVILKTE